jgi:hypothetical protein
MSNAQFDETVANLKKTLFAWVETIRKKFVPSTDIDDYAEQEGRLLEIGRRVPATPWGRELMTSTWPKLYPPGYTSETYLGSAVVLMALQANLRQGMSIADIQQKITVIDDSLKRSQLFLPNTHRAGTAAMALANAWERTATGYPADKLLIAFESELIYAARMFAAAREQEAAGATLQ